MPTITRPDLIEHLRQEAGVSESIARRVLDALFDADSGLLPCKLATGYEVHIAGFGKFTPKTRQPRTARNPRTRAAVALPERTVATFKPGAGLRRRMTTPLAPRTPEDEAE